MKKKKLLSQDQVRQIFFIHCRQVDVTQDGSLNDAWPHFFGAALTEVPERIYIKKMVEKLYLIFKILTSQQLLFRPLLQSFPHQGVFPSMAAPPHKEKLNMKSKIFSNPLDTKESPCTCHIVNIICCQYFLKSSPFSNPPA